MRRLDEVAKIKALVATVRLKLPSARHGEVKAPAVVLAIVEQHWPQVYEDKPLAKHLIWRGLDAEVRPILGRYLDNQTGARLPADQLEMWPEREREIAARLEGMTQVFVPGRGAHVALCDPQAMTPDEMVEAAHYRIAQGHGCIRTGNVLLELADARRQALAA